MKRNYWFTVICVWTVGLVSLGQDGFNEEQPTEQERVNILVPGSGNPGDPLFDLIEGKWIDGQYSLNHLGKDVNPDDSEEDDLGGDPDLQSEPNPSEENPFDLVGIDPATLRPLSFSLSDVFPAFQISDELSLKVPLAYGSDLWAERVGYLRYASPKSWLHHYGELIELVPVSSADPPNISDYVYQPIQLYYVNAEGQTVDFFPSQRDGDVGEDELWLSDSGNYRLARRSVTGQNYAFEFDLKTSSGMVFTFEPYHHQIEGDILKGLTIRYRVSKISDRLGNYIDVGYVSGTGDPTYFRAYSTDGASQILVHEIEYFYDSQNRLSRVRMPAFANNQVPQPATTHTYDVVYPDTATYSGGAARSVPGREFKGAAAQVDASAGTNIVGLNPYNNNPLSAIIDSTLSDPQDGKSGGGTVHFNMSDLVDDVPHIQPFVVPDASSGRGFSPNSMVMEVNQGSVTAFFLVSRYSKQIAGDISSVAYYSPESSQGRTHTMKYRYHDESSYYATHPDRVLLTYLGGSTSFVLSGTVNIRVFPMVNEGDVVLTGLTKQTVTGLSFSGNQFQAVLSGPVSGNAYLWRQENLERIQEIRFPESTTFGTRRHLFFTYDDFSLNHQEIQSIEVFDASVEQATTPILAINYEYERIRTFASDEDLDGANIKSKRYYKQCFAGGVKLPSLPFVDEIEQMVVRSKQVRSWRLDPVNESQLLPTPAQDLTTRFGGRFHWTLAGTRTTGRRIGHVFDNECTIAYWGIDGKPFDFTWQIHPDGSATIFDLDPGGTDLEDLLANFSRRRMVFKTYRFDTAFLSAMSNAGFDHLVGLAGPIRPFFELAPKHPLDMTTPDFSAPIFTLAQPNRTSLFEGISSKCYQLQVTSYEPVPIYQLTLSDRLPHEEIPILFGQLESSGSGAGYRMVSPFDTAILDLSTLSQAQLFVLGNLQSTDIPYTRLDFLPGTFNVSWTRKRQLPTHFFYNYASVYAERTKISQLRPHFSYTATKLDGFEWSEFHQVPVVEPQFFDQGTRSSQGGLVAYRKAGVTTDPTTGDTVLQGLETITLGFGYPSGTILPGDVFFHMHRCYTVDSVAGDTITFHPPLAHNLRLEQYTTFPPILKFYRYFNPEYDPDYLSFDLPNGYHGYDAFGNSAYAETYVKGVEWEGSWSLQNGDWVYSGDPQRVLIPKLGWGWTGATDPNSNPGLAAISWSDATASENQDLAGWNYFGRATQSWKSDRRKRFVDDALETYAYDTATDGVEDLNKWQVSKYEYDATYAWKPSVVSNYFNLVTAQIYEVGTINPINHDDDRFTWTLYHNANDSQKKGQVRDLFEFDRRHTSGFNPMLPNVNQLTAYSYQAIDYSYGRADVSVQAGYDAGTINYLMASDSTLDGNTGLVMSATERIISGQAITLPLVSLDVSTWNQRGRTQYTYDNLGQVRFTASYDAADQLFGPVSEVDILQPLKNISHSETPDTGDQLNRSTSWLDGIGLMYRTRSQRGVTSNEYETTMTYDSSGRPESEYAPYLVGNSPSAYVQTYYNERGEPWGSTQWLNGQSVGSSWVVRDHQLGSGLLRTHTFQHIEDDSVFASSPQVITINRVIRDAYGNLGRVENLSVDYSGSLGTPSQSIIDLVTGADDPVTTADYRYDAQGNLILAYVGSSPVQTRQFVFDNWGRLRREKHPEMTDVVYASNVYPFNQFGNPTAVMQSNREITYDFDASGNTIDVKGLVNGVLKHWSKTFYEYEKTNPSVFMETPVFMKAGTSTSGQTIGYIHHHDPLNGLLTSRELIHDITSFSDLAYYSGLYGYDDVDNLNLVSIPLQLSYGYDSSARVTTIGYPHRLPNNDDPVTLHIVFDEDRQEVVRIEELSLTQTIEGVTSPLELISGLTYDQSGSMSRNDMPGGLGMRVLRDGLHRVASMGWVHPSGVENRTYDYLQSGRIGTITPSGDTSSSVIDRFGYDPFGQLVNAHVAAGLTTNSQFAFQYDTHGNMNEINGTLISVDSATNQLTETGYGYNAFGELTDFEDTAGASFDATYSAFGRLESVDKNQTLLESYVYDPGGMRTAVLDQVGAPRLYFYSEANMVLSEFVKDTASTKWDKSYIYHEGRSVLTYESQDHTLPSALIEAPALTTPETINEPTLSWALLPGYDLYDVEVGSRDSGGKIVGKSLHESVKGTQLELGFGTSPGTLAYRVRVHQRGQWSDWGDTELTALESNADQPIWLSLNGHTNDASLHGNDAIPYGAVPTDGVVGQGYAFDFHDQIQIPSPVGAPTGVEAAGTAMIWVKPIVPGPNTWQSAMRVFRIGSTNDRVIANMFDDGNIKGNLAGTAYVQTQGSKVVFGEWNHIAVTFDASYFKIYVNGSLVLTGNSPQGYSINPDIIYLGSYNYTYWPDFQGDMDEFAVYSRVLSEEEIKERFYRESPIQLVGQYDFDVLNTKITPDSSGNGNDAQVNEVIWTVGRDGSPNSAFTFSNSGSRIFVYQPTNFPVGAMPYTVSGWFKPTSYLQASQNPVAVFGDGAACTSHIFNCNNDNTVSGDLDCIGVEQKAGEMLSFNDWNHFALVFDGNDTKGYLNGQWVMSVATPGQELDTSGLLLGWVSPTRRFLGAIDDVRVYKGAMTWEQVNAEYLGQ